MGCDVGLRRIDDVKDICFRPRDECIESWLVTADTDVAAMAERVLLADRQGRDVPPLCRVEDVQTGMLVIEPEMIGGDAGRPDAVIARLDQPVGVIDIAGDRVYSSTGSILNMRHPGACGTIQLWRRR